ncbi:hypothetical protein [Streptomyces hoynatensis]|uniref:Uncharacterized protein n=1 Tax=Streptomyces hoynatensis TaxID=1141874 RepID=A0A3A9YNX6_9ACTN|nr:hypothetical protein [Streptomyces hoynatensis]RKN37740.1 hypothetical protein D7294_26655 [Streptomyces hoynatensis]
MSPTAARRSLARRAGESAFGALLLARTVFLGLVVALLVVAGIRASWPEARPAMFAEEADRGTLTLRACDREACTGVFAPTGAEVVLRQAIGREAGERLPVALLPEDGEVVRTGAAGVLFAWLPLTGALLLSSVVLGGALRLYRTAWSLAGLALAALALTFALWI